VAQGPQPAGLEVPFRPGYSAAGTVVAVGKDVQGWKEGDRVSFPGNHASAELLTIGHERGRLWRLPDGMDMERAAVACVARYGLGAAIRCGITLGRSAAVLGLGIIGQFALRSFLAAGACPWSASTLSPCAARRLWLRGRTMLSTHPRETSGNSWPTPWGRVAPRWSPTPRACPTRSRRP